MQAEPTALESQYPLERALDCYVTAADIDPMFAEAYESIGYFLDVYGDSPGAAEPYFKRAIRHGGGVDSYLGLARVMAELGFPNEANRVLDGLPLNSRAAADVVELRSEIAQGIWFNS